ncbi:MAG TPA: cyclic peptide export ABC transporter [Acidobacteriaceae bacterium]|nr:cyclic peptide export ABC transporter [Acidobacteriaceae bacterium]
MRIIRFLFGYAPGVIIATTAISAVAGLGTVWLLMIFNSHLRGVIDGNEDIWKFIALCSAAAVSSFIARVSISKLALWSSFDLRLQLGRQWINTPLAELEREGNAKLLSAVTQDVDRLSESMRSLPALLVDYTVTIASFFYMGYLSWKLLLVLVCFMLMLTVTRELMRSKFEQYLREAHSFAEMMLATYNAMNGGIKELKMNMARWNGFYTGELYDVSTKYRDRSYSAELLFGVIYGYSEVAFFIFVGLLIYGAKILGGISHEVMISFMIAFLYIRANMDRVIDSGGQFARAGVALDNLQELGVFRHSASMSVSELHSRTSRDRVATAVENDVNLGERLRASGCSIKLASLRHTYESVGGEHGFEFGPINLSINAGELLFITGGNGSGKTTFAKLLCGLYEPGSGEVWLNGVRVQAENRAWYAQHFGTVFSDSYLFSKLYGTEDLPQTDAVIRRYLREFRLEEKVQVHEGRFSTISLSQGQRKRLALVTTYVEDRPIYLFDEWAADQDPEFREFFYHKILPELKAKGKTVIVISHDDRYYHVADRIIKLESGCLAKELPQGEAVPA